jgi:hypothetical protein
MNWEKFWGEFDELADQLESEFQDDMVAKHGKGYYYLSDEERWNRQKKIIQSLITKEKA